MCLSELATLESKLAVLVVPSEVKSKVHLWSEEVSWCTSTASPRQKQTNTQGRMRHRCQTLQRSHWRCEVRGLLQPRTAWAYKLCKKSPAPAVYAGQFPLTPARLAV